MFSSIGIALAAYRPEPRYFFEQLSSIRAQSYSGWRCWVSFDSPLEDFRSDPKFRVFFEDPRFSWSENRQTLGHLKNFEKAIQSVLALGVDAIACCDQDDIWYPEKLAKSLAALQFAGPMGLVFCDMKLINAEDWVSEKTAWQIERRGVDFCGSTDLLVRNVIAGTGMLMDAQLAVKFPIVPEAARFHDHWYPLVASFLGAIVPINTPLYSYRIHGDNVVGVTPYKGLFAHRSQQGILAKCIQNWRRSEELALAAKSQGLKLSGFEQVAFLSRWDCGVGLFFFGIGRLISDPPLARAAFARAVGKLASVVKKKEHSG